MTLSASETRIVITGAMVVLFLAALEQTIVATALPSIANSLGGFDLLSWVVTIYLLTATCATLVLGKLSDMYGRRIVLNACIVTFLAASVLCAVADSMIMLIAARALQGLGGGGLMTLSHATVGDAVPPRERGRYAGYFATVWATASLLGPTLGGFLTEYAGWRWVFWINLPIGLAGLLITDRVMRRLPQQHRKSHIPYADIALFVAGSMSFMLALTWGGSAFAWTDPRVLGGFALSIVCSWMFFRRQGVSAQPILPPGFLKDAVIGPTLVAAFLAFGVYIVMAVLPPTYFQLALGAPASQVGLLMIPLLLSATIGALVSGRAVTWTGNYKQPPAIGLPLAVLALAILAWEAEAISPLAASVLMAFVGAGIGTFFPVSMTAVQNAVDPADMGAVTGALGFSRSLGGAVAVAAASALLLSLIAAWVPGAGHIEGLQDLVRQPLDEAERVAIAQAFGVLFAALAGVLLLCLAVFSRVAGRELRSGAVDAAGEGAE
jgi:MFS family permease